MLRYIVIAEQNVYIREGLKYSESTEEGERVSGSVVSRHRNNINIYTFLFYHTQSTALSVFHTLVLSFVFRLNFFGKRYYWI